MNEQAIDIAIIGGTGQLGGALARRLAKAGKRVTLGSRDAQKGAAAAHALSDELKLPVWSATLAEAASAATDVFVTVPYATQAATLMEIRPFVAGKIVVDTTVPLVPPKVMRVQLPSGGCAALAAQTLLGENVRLVTAFHNVAAHHLATDAAVQCDVLVFGDDKAARQHVIELVQLCGLRGLHAGSLANSAAAEALTSILIFINRNYEVDGAGIQISGTLRIPGM